MKGSLIAKVGNNISNLAGTLTGGLKRDRDTRLEWPESDMVE